MGAANSPMVQRTTTDLLGRTIRTEKPGPLGPEFTENYYDQKGRLTRTAQSGQADTLYTYDALGNPLRTGLDIDANGQLDPASMDRISESDTAYSQIGGNWWQQTTQRIYPNANDPSAVTAAIQRTQVSGLLEDGERSETVAIDSNGNTTVSRTIIERATQTQTQTIDAPDSTIDARTISVNGRVMESRSKTGIVTTFAYDALGRQTGVTDPRTGTALTHYNAQGRIDYLQDAAGHRTSFSYDPATGRKIGQTDALDKTTRFAYSPQGQSTRTWGQGAYPVKYDYDAYGRMIAMTTYRAEQGFDGEVFPATATGDTTGWHYDEATGLLAAKQYADGSRITYTYTTGGRLATRTWARKIDNQPLVTTYIYDPATYELTRIDYSDATADIVFVYDRLGRQSQISDALGTHSFTYTSALQLHSETITGLYDAVLTRTYETTGVPGRATGFSLDDGYTIAYGYDPWARFNKVSWSASGQSDSATYGYVPNSDLLQQMATPGGRQTTYAYEPHRNLKTQVQNRFGTTTISQYDYVYDPVARRTAVANTGTAFAQPAFSAFGYNDRSELTGASRYLGQDIHNTADPVPAEQRGYQYDPIGNRTQATKAGMPTGYSANALNQYTAVTGADAFTPAYDADGNLQNAPDGRRYLYNAENRLIAVQPQTPGNGSTRVEFVYDWMGRRVQKIVSSYSNGVWSPEQEIQFVYDGWNLIKQTTIATGGSSVDKYFVWGLDLSQSLQGAGGVGGLIASVQGSLTHQYCFDANGNVGQMIDAASGAVAAHYEYDPFGNEVRAVGPMAGENAYRFSTKYYDSEGKLYYYGFRYYTPELGRWINRDPKGERGGDNLYLFVSNNPAALYDLLGLWGAGDHRRLTVRAFGQAEPSSGLENYQVDISIFLQNSNVSVDDDLLSDNRWHFNRDIDQKNENVVPAIANYKKLLAEQWEKMEDKIKKPNKENCKEALRIGGMLSHAWQDYYAHAIDINSDGSKETIGRIDGDPGDPGVRMKPASWGYFGWKVWNTNLGEHGASEPGSRAPDTTERLSMAENYTQLKLHEFLGVWVAPCKCYLKEIFK